MNKYGQFEEEPEIQKYFPENYIGSCIDIGAYDGIVSSNTKAFEELGWYCLCIEPNPRSYKDLKKNRLHAVNYAISYTNDDMILNIVDLGNHHEDAITSLKIDERLIKQHINYGYNLSYDHVIVEVTTLDNCINDFYKSDKIDFISIDTEGTELDVLKGFSIEKWNPKLMIIENNFDEPFIEDYLKLFNYKKENRLGVNDFYVYQQ
jgi:FkbM family methyltransferase